MALIRRARNLIHRSESSRRQNANKLFAGAKETYIRMWNTIWSYERIINLCTDTVICSTVDISSKAVLFENDSESMAEVLKGMLRQLRRASGKKNAGRNLLNSMNQLSASNKAALAEIPKFQSECTGSV